MGVHLLMVADREDARAYGPVLDPLWRSLLRITPVADDHLADPWVGHAWTYEPLRAPQGSRVLQQVLALVAAARRAGSAERGPATRASCAQVSGAVARPATLITTWHTTLPFLGASCTVLGAEGSTPDAAFPSVRTVTGPGASARRAARASGWKRPPAATTLIDSRSELPEAQWTFHGLSGS